MLAGRGEADDFVPAKGLNERESLAPTRIDAMTVGRADAAVKENTRVCAHTIGYT